MTKKLMALLLAVLMAVSLLPMPAMADDAVTISSPSEITEAGSYVLNKEQKEITLKQPVKISGEVTLELTGQTIKLPSVSDEDPSVFHVMKEGGKLTLKGKGTIEVPDNASGILVESGAELSILGEISISGGANGVNATSGESGVKINVNTLGTIQSTNGINLSGASGEIKIASGTVKGSNYAIAPGKDNAPTLGSIMTSAALYINGTAATQGQLGAVPTAEMKELVFDDGKAPELTVSSAKRTSETEATVTFTASKAGTYYYQLTEATAAEMIENKPNEATLVRGTNTISLTGLDGNEHTVYIAAKDAFGKATESAVTAAVPAVLAAPAGLAWNDKTATWDAIDGVTAYNVQLFRGEAMVKEYDASGTSVDCTDAIAADGSYTFKVRVAANNNTVGAWSAPSKALTVDTADKTAPELAQKSITRGALDSASIVFTSSEAGTLYYLVGGDDAADVFAEENKKEPAVTTGDNTLAITGLTSADAVTVRIGVKDEAGNKSDILKVDVPLFVTAPVISNESASRSDASNGSVTFTSDKAGTVYYIVGGEKPASAEAMLAAENKQEQGINANEEVTLNLSGLGTEATNVHFMVVDADGKQSEIKTVTVPVYLSKPTMADWFNGTTNARWNAVEDATGYNVQLFKDGNAFGNATFVNGGTNTSVDLASSMTEDGVYTFQVQATATNAQSEWSDVSATSYTRDVLKPTVKAADPPRRIDAKTAEFSFIASEDGTYYYMVGLVNGGVPTSEQVADDKNPHAGCTNAKTTIRLTDIADANARKVYVVVRDKAGNLSEKPFEITVPAYTATVTPTPTPTAAPVTPTPTPTAAPTTYTVTLQGGTGYTIAATGGSKSPVNAGGSFSFTVTPSSGYTRGNGFAVKANGTTLTSNNGVYTISNINANQTVSVSGIVKSQTGGGTLPAAPAITTTTLAAATMGKEYRQQITATGGTPITWSYSGTLPDGMTLAANTGILSGTPTQEGSFRFAVKATNSTGFSTRQMTLVVSGSEYSVTKGANSEWTQGGDKGIDFSGSGKGTFTVKVDGAAVAAGKYTASADGSTVTLSPEYLDTLAAGSHTVTLVYSDGSAKAKFTIKAKDKTVAPTVSSQPTDADVAPDGSATFTVTASGTTPLLCQWQVDKNDGSGWTDISGAVNASYTVEKVTAEQNGWKYRCVIKNAAGSVESNAATLTIKEAIGDVKKNDDQKDANSGGLGRILLITGIVVAVLALAAGLYFYFRRRKSTRYMD